MRSAARRARRPQPREPAPRPRRLHALDHPRGALVAKPQQAADTRRVALDPRQVTVVGQRVEAAEQDAVVNLMWACAALATE